MEPTNLIEFSCDDSFVSTVAKLAEMTSTSKAEVLKNAINLYWHAVHEYVVNGKGIIFQAIDDTEVSNRKVS